MILCHLFREVKSSPYLFYHENLARHRIANQHLFRVAFTPTSSQEAPQSCAFSSLINNNLVIYDRPQFRPLLTRQPCTPVALPHIPPQTVVPCQTSTVAVIPLPISMAEEPFATANIVHLTATILVATALVRGDGVDRTTCRGKTKEMRQKETRTTTPW